MSGLEATREIRSHERASNTKDPTMIIALTGVGSAAIQKEACCRPLPHETGPLQ